MVSIIVPVFNEEEGIVIFYEQLKKVLATTGKRYEILFIDDGSTDGSFPHLQEIANQDKQVRVVSFSRNFGHMKALSAGYKFAKGDAVISMDGDLQHPPELIPMLLQKWEEGYEVVNTIRTPAKNERFFKKCSASIFYSILNRISRVKIVSHAADFRLVDRSVVDALNELKEHSRFLRGLISWVGYKQCFVNYEAHARTAGKTKYSFLKMLSFAIDGITSFSSFPLRMATYVGLVIALLSFFYILYALYLKLLGRAVLGWASVLVVVLFMGGVQLIFLGIIGEYISKVYEETKQRPLYIIKKTINM